MIDDEIRSAILGLTQAIMAATGANPAEQTNLWRYLEQFAEAIIKQAQGRRP